MKSIFRFKFKIQIQPDVFISSVTLFQKNNHFLEHLEVHCSIFGKLLGVPWLPCPRWPRTGASVQDHTRSLGQSRTLLWERALFPHLALPVSHHHLSCEDSRKASHCHSKYYGCLWYAEEQEGRLHLLLPGGRRTRMKAGKEELEGRLGKKRTRKPH